MLGKRKCREESDGELKKRTKKRIETYYKLAGKRVPASMIVEAMMETMRVTTYRSEFPLFRGVSAEDESGPWYPFCKKGDVTFMTPDVSLAYEYGNVWNNNGTFQRVYRFDIREDRTPTLLVCMDHVYMPPNGTEERNAIDLFERNADALFDAFDIGDCASDDGCEDLLTPEQRRRRTLARCVMDKSMLGILEVDDDDEGKGNDLKSAISPFFDYVCGDQYDGGVCFGDTYTIKAFNAAIHAKLGLEGKAKRYVKDKEDLSTLAARLDEEGSFPFNIDGMVTSECGAGAKEIAWFDPAKIMYEPTEFIHTIFDGECSTLSSLFSNGDIVLDEMCEASSNMQVHAWNAVCERHRPHCSPESFVRLCYRARQIDVFKRNYPPFSEAYAIYAAQCKFLSILDAPDFLDYTIAGQ